MSIDLTTPALLFSTISLLLLAYTNRFLALASIIRKLHSDHQSSPNPIYVDQIANLRKRVNLIRDMQTFGVGSLLTCTVCMMLLFAGWSQAGVVAFSISLLLMAISLTYSIVEIRISVGALDLHLSDMELGDASESKCHKEGPGTFKNRWNVFRFSLSSVFWMFALTALAMLWSRDHLELERRILRLSGQDLSGWSTDQVLGTPNTNGFGDIATAWASKAQDQGPEWIIVEYPTMVQVVAIEVHETHNPGALIEIRDVSYRGHEVSLWKGTDPLANSRLPGGIAAIRLAAPVRTRRIKLILDSAKVPGWNEIDAIALIDANGKKSWATAAWSSSSFGAHRAPPRWYWP